MKELQEKFNKRFFAEKNVHHSTMNFLHGRIQSEYFESNEPYIDEGFIAKEVRGIVEKNRLLSNPLSKLNGTRIIESITNYWKPESEEVSIHNLTCRL